MHQTKFSYLVEKLPDEKLASQNAVFCNFKDMSTLKQSTGAGDKFFIKINKKVIELKPAEGVRDGYIAMSRNQRKMQRRSEIQRYPRCYSRKISTGMVRI